MISRIYPSIPMQFADNHPSRGVCSGALAMVCLIAAMLCPVQASPVRIATLGGDSRLVLDSTNLFDYPALVRQMAHADIELFDDWAGIALPIGTRHGIALFLNRPDDGLDELANYVSTTGSPLLRSLHPRPWLDAIYGIRMNSGLSLAAALRYSYDVRNQGLDEAGVSRWDTKLGLAAGNPFRGLDAALSLERVSLRDNSMGSSRNESDGNGFGIDLRGRWGFAEDAILLPSVVWRKSDFGLALEEFEIEEVRGAVAINVRPSPAVLGVLGLVVSGQWQRSRDPANGIAATELKHWVLPAVIAAGEIQIGSLLFRLGARHESIVDEQEGPDGVDLSFDAGLVTNVGLGFEFDDLAIDGRLEKNFLRDGPHFIGGSSRGGGLLTTLSCVYRFYE